jgi:hypothetical protein
MRLIKHDPNMKIGGILYMYPGINPRKTTHVDCAGGRVLQKILLEGQAISNVGLTTPCPMQYASTPSGEKANKEMTSLWNSRDPAVDLIKLVLTLTDYADLLAPPYSVINQVVS